MQEPIYVWACCGALGYTIPWPEWHARGVWPLPTPGGDPNARYVYLFSIKGQLGDESRAEGVTPGEGRLADPARVAAINVDDFLDDALAVDWPAVLREVQRVAAT